MINMDANEFQSNLYIIEPPPDNHFQANPEIIFIPDDFQGIVHRMMGFYDLNGVSEAEIYWC